MTLGRQFQYLYLRYWVKFHGGHWEWQNLGDDADPQRLSRTAYDQVVEVIEHISDRCQTVIRIFHNGQSIFEGNRTDLMLEIAIDPAKFHEYYFCLAECQPGHQALLNTYERREVESLHGGPIKI